MLNLLKKGIILLHILLFSSNGFSQAEKLNNHLNTKEKKKIASAEKLIRKGDDIIAKVNDLEEQVEALKNAEGRIKTRKINKYNTKIADAKMKAAIFFEDGYNKHIKALDKRIKELAKEGNSNAISTRSEVKTLKKKAQKQYNKSERLKEPSDVIEMLELARENQNEAIEVQIKFLLTTLADNEKPKEVNEIAGLAPLTVAVDTIATIKEDEPQNKTFEQVSPTTTETSVTSTSTVQVAATTGVETTAVAVIAEEAEIPVIKDVEKKLTETTINESNITETPEKEIKDVFLTIQFLADKEKASEEQIKQAYSGSLRIIEKKGNGWYRYSVGQYTDVVTARETMQKEGIKGFIVAYNKDQRISVKEALELISAQ